MKIIRNSIGWEDEEGFQLAYDIEHSFMNVGRKEEFKRPIWKEKEIGDDSQQPRMKQTRGGELKLDEGLHSTNNGSPADIVSKFKAKEDRSFLGSYAEFWDNPEDDRWDKEEEKQDENS